MRASALLAAVAAGFFGFTAASAAEEGLAASKRNANGRAHSVASKNVVAAQPVSEGQNAPTAARSLSPVNRSVGGSSAEPTVAALATPPVPRKAAAPTLIVKINLTTQAMTLSYDGMVGETWAISSGRAGYATPRGVFRPQWSSRMWYSRKYDNAPMPHAVFFVGGVAVHGTQATRMLGTPASHGCVRLAPANAARFYSLVHKHGYARTRIEVFGTPPATRVAKRDAPARVEQMSVRPRAVVRPGVVAGAGSGLFGWVAPNQVEQLQRGPNGLIYLPPDSPLRGRETFVHNGVVYRRVR